MADFSHWNFAEDFDGWEVAALILGVEPRDSGGEEARIRVVWERLRADFQRALSRCICDHYGGPPFYTGKTFLKSIDIDKLERYARLANGRSAARDDLETPQWWRSQPKKQNFEEQRFTRSNVSDWLREVGQPSGYEFSTEQPNSRPSSGVEVDPSDLPEELQVANLAFRAVFNGFGDASATFKNRLISYLETHYSHFGSEAIKRIATVANPHKEPGRKRHERK